MEVVSQELQVQDANEVQSTHTYLTPRNWIGVDATLTGTQAAAADAKEAMLAEVGD